MDSTDERRPGEEAAPSAVGETSDTRVPPSVTDWEARLAAQTAAYRERQATKRAIRAAFKRRRDAGLKQRHAAKLRR